MEHSALLRISLLSATILAVASCGSGYPQVPQSSVNPPLSERRSVGARSWMEPNAKGRLLYVSDYNNNIVQVYNYPSKGTQNPPAGTLTGFSGGPQGMCIDKSHNVYITNNFDQDVLKYAYGASTPSATYAVVGDFPVGCAWDPTTGNLAVADDFGAEGGVGVVNICRSPSKCSEEEEPAGLLECFFIVYMPNGDLYVDGMNSYGFAMAYRAKAATSWQPVSVSGVTINFPGNIQWDGHYLALGDQEGPLGYSVIYRCSPSFAHLTCNGGQVPLRTSTDVVQFFITRDGKGVVGPDGANADTWAYPAGGDPLPKKIIHVKQENAKNIGAAILSPP